MARRIKLKVIELKIGGQEVTFDYKEQILTLVNAPAPGKQGFSSDDIRQGLAIKEKLAKANGTLVVEDDEWAFIKGRCVGRDDWRFMDQAILDFEVAVSEAEQKDAK